MLSNRRGSCLTGDKTDKGGREEGSKPVEEFEDWKLQGLDSLFQKTGGNLEPESTKNEATLFKLSEKQVC